ncbi:unannotated protein [freshwater metagenome]|uniref:Unannotated protein n=1 Tax=freshwater metagenome TaxID=449393 RepID=A0A6J7AW03_9ZZZZ
MLPVGIDLNQRLIALALGIEKGGAHGPADTNIEWQRDHHGSGLLGDLGGVIGRTVINHQNARGWQVLLNLGDDVGDRALLIPGGDRDKCTPGHNI